MSTNQFVATMLLAIIPGLTLLGFACFSKDLKRSEKKFLWTVTILMTIGLLAIKKWIA